MRFFCKKAATRSASHIMRIPLMMMAMIMSSMRWLPVASFFAKAIADRIESKEKITFIVTMSETVFATEAGLLSL